MASYGQHGSASDLVSRHGSPLLAFCSSVVAIIKNSVTTFIEISIVVIIIDVISLLSLKILALFHIY
jgi:hypothetical protein